MSYPLRRGFAPGAAAAPAMTLHPRLAQLDRRPLPGGLTLLVASTSRARGRGLAGLDELPAGHALLLEPCRSVHTLGMRFELDLVWLEADGGVVRVDAAVGPRRVRSCGRARAVVECGAHQGEGFAAALAAARDGARPAAADDPAAV